jgi:hypothetical protein
MVPGVALQVLAKSDGETEGIFVVEDDLLDELVLMLLKGSLCDVQSLGGLAQAPIQDLPGVGQDHLRPVAGQGAERPDEPLGDMGGELFQLSFRLPGRPVLDLAHPVAGQEPPPFVPLIGRLLEGRKLLRIADLTLFPMWAVGTFRPDGAIRQALLQIAL